MQNLKHISIIIHRLFIITYTSYFACNVMKMLLGIKIFYFVNYEVLLFKTTFILLRQINNYNIIMN